MRVTVAGAGYVGLTTAVCLAHFGHEVVCVDIDARKIATLQSGKSTIFEPQIEELMHQNAHKLSYSTDFTRAYASSSVIIIGVGTPELPDGSVDLSYLYQIVDEISTSIQSDCVIILKSTVPVGTNEEIERRLRELVDPRFEVSVVSNPEFLSQGSAVADTLFPSRVVIGTSDKQSERVMRELYGGYSAEIPLIFTSPRSAEMAKYASNDFLALKISYVNELANLCERNGSSISEVTSVMGLDPRIGPQFLRAGIGFGGSCFPKDTKGLCSQAKELGYDMRTISAAIAVNEEQKLVMIRKLQRHFPSLSGVRVAVLGLAFKPNTDDVREAPSLKIIPELLAQGAKVCAFDPFATTNFKRELASSIKIPYELMSYCKTIGETLEGADVCLILTEWAEICSLRSSDFSLMRAKIVIDGRNCLDCAGSSALIYEGIG